MSDHFIKLGDTMSKTVSTYNQTVGSLERNVLSSAEVQGASSCGAEQLDEMSAIESGPRTLDASKWQVLEAAKRG